MQRTSRGLRARLVSVLVVAGLALAGPGLAGSALLPAADAAPGGQISGTVTNAAGDPVAGITVTAYVAGAGDFAAQATTKKDGTYTLRKLAAADYAVQFQDNSDSPLYATQFYDGKSDFQDATPVTVAASQRVPRIDAVLARFGSITGTVTDDQGNPLGGIFVDVLRITDNGPPFESPAGGTTASDGTFDIGFIPPGDSYVVGFNDLSGTYVPEYYDDRLSIFEADQITVTPAGVTPGIDARLATAGHLSGTVTNSDGQGLGGIGIQLAHLVDGDWFSYGEEFNLHTQDDGSYAIDGLPAGTWRIGFQDPDGNYLFEYYDDKGLDFGQATDVPVAAGETVSGIDAVLTRSAHVSGTVTDEQGVPLSDVSVLLWHPSPEDGHPEIASDTQTGADGTYRLSGIPGGTYTLSFQSQGDFVDEYYDDTDQAHATPVVVGEGASVTGIDARLAKAAHITGTAADPDGNGFEFLAVNAFRWTGSTWELVSTSFGGTQDNDPANDTHYDVPGLSPGTYRLEFDAYDTFTTPTGGGLTEVAHEFYDDQPSIELARDIVVTTDGEVLSGYDAVLERGQYPDAVQNLTPPTISGTPQVGRPLTASPGTWNIAATTFHYQWLAGSSQVGADAPTYTPTAADVGKTVTVVVTGAVAGLDSAAATSAATAPVAPATDVPPPPPPAPTRIANLRAPVVKGHLVVGSRARVTPGTWNPAGVALAYQWFVGGKLVVKAHGSRLLLKSRWVGRRIVVKVTATAPGFLTTKVRTAASARIAQG
jgi:5-hydroxyisourate hydrolase-like protein (transthyretin family)